MQSLISIITNLDNAARIPALRAVVHTSLSRTIGSIRQHLRNEERSQRNDEANDGLDARNEYDEANRSVNEIAEASGFSTTVPPMKMAAAYHQLWRESNDALGSLITTTFDKPLGFDQMLKFMVESAQPLDETVLKALADIVKCDIKTLRQMHELQDRADREKLKAMSGDIKRTFEGLSLADNSAEFSNGYEDEFDGWDILPETAKHQLGIKIVEALGKAKNRVLLSVMRTRRLTDLGSISLIDDGIKQVSDWVEAFEQAHATEIAAALEAGQFLRTLDEVRA